MSVPLKEKFMVVLGGCSFLEPVCLYKVWEWQRKPVMEVSHKKWGAEGAPPGGFY